MEIDGTSQFITDKTYNIERKETGNIYKLGCGPANSDWSGCK